MVWIALGLALVTADVRTADIANPVTTTRITSPQKALRFEVTVPGTLDDVWSAFTTREGLATWLWSEITIDLCPGGDWLAQLPGGKTAGGTIQSFTPKRQLVIAALAPEQFPTVRERRTTAVFEFKRVTATSTKVTLVQSGWEEGPEWDRAYEYLAVGNATLLTQLYRRFESGPVDWTKAR